MKFVVGIDVGNYDTKSQNTNTPSGYSISRVKPMMANEMLCFNDLYYVPSIEDRFPYVMDKTKNDQALILTLFGIAKEILYYLKNSPNFHNLSVPEMQAEIDKIDKLELGAGLPPGHLDALLEKTKAYYYEKMSEGISFSYKDISLKDELNFHFKLTNCAIYPQDFAGTLLNKEVDIPTKFNKYVIIGVGGYTVDTIPVIDRQPDAKKCKSLPIGTRVMYEEMIARVQSTTGLSVSERGIEDILFGREHILSDEVVDVVNTVAMEFSDLIINRCHQIGIEFSENPIIFLGGGCLLLKDYLETNPLIKKAQFISDVHANARNYARFIAASSK